MPEHPSEPAILPASGKPTGAAAAAMLARREPGALNAVFMMCTLAAVDGTVLLLAASGRLSSPAGAMVVGLNVIAGAGAWLAARDAFAGRSWHAADVGALAALGVAIIGSTVAAAWLGLRLGAIDLVVLPKAAGLVLLLIGAQIAGVRLPHPARLPLPVFATVSAVVLELLSHAEAAWIP